MDPKTKRPEMPSSIAKKLSKWLKSAKSPPKPTKQTKTKTKKLSIVEKQRNKWGSSGQFGAKFETILSVGIFQTDGDEAKASRLSQTIANLPCILI